MIRVAQGDPNEPSLPKGGRFWRIVVVESSIRGELYEY